MNKNKFIKIWSFPGLSIQQRLPLLLCILLFGAIVTFGYTAYIGVRNAELSAGKERLNSLTNQMSALFHQANRNIIPATKEIAHQLPIKKYLQSNGKDSGPEAKQILNDKRKNSTPLVELFNVNRVKVLSSDINGINININRDSVLPLATVNTSFGEIGKLYWIDKKMYFPVTVTVADEKQITGYIVEWRRFTTSQQEIDQLSELMGSGSAFYIGNNDGTFWTNGLVPISPPPVDLKNIQNVVKYNGPKNYPVMASAKLIANTRWLLLIALSQKTVTATSNRFLFLIFIIGTVLITIGIFIAWLLSRNITKPLNELTAAASAIADGNYSLHVDVDRKDELSKLAEAFNTMAVQVSNAQHDLEKKVIERTAQLETVNKELEAFTYSISHDLRAPLRGIIGFTTILEEDYGSNLDSEAKRITSVIKDNSLKMGHLIDDLLTFSRMGRQDIAKTNINTNTMVKQVIEELTPENKIRNIERVVQSLPVIKGDIGTIRQVWVNLISNAIKYSGKKEKPCIEIGSFIHEEQVAFFIKDNGVGFDEKYKDKLFKVFQRLHSADEFEGTGVGLALVEKIISKHGGKVWATGQVDQGATFYFSLPVDTKNVTREL